MGDNDSAAGELLSAQWVRKGEERRRMLEKRLLKIWLQSYSVMCPISKWVPHVTAANPKQGELRTQECVRAAGLAWNAKTFSNFPGGP